MLVASGSLAAAKFVVGVMIGSLALISDALHSLIDFGATVVTWFAVRAADRPPDPAPLCGRLSSPYAPRHPMTPPYARTPATLTRSS